MCNNFKVPCEKVKTVSYASVIMKNIVVFAFPSQARFPLKLVCCIAFGPASNLDQLQSLHLFLSFSSIY